MRISIFKIIGGNQKNLLCMQKINLVQVNGPLEWRQINFNPSLMGE